jgi:hypothetical protein
MLSSRSPEVRELASDAGKISDLQYRGLGVSLSRFRFSETTVVAILTILVQRYKIEPNPKLSGEPFERLKDRYSQGKVVLTLT